MKVELQNGDRITIPEGCKAIVNGNEVVIEKEEKEGDFKRGDILVSLSNEIILVDDYDFKGGHLYSFVHVDRCGQLSKEPYFQWNEWHDWRLATEEEKQLLFDKMKEQGLKWNAEEKRVEKIRWRAKKGEAYCRAIDWEQRRYELAKDAMNGILSAPVVAGVNPNPSVEDIAMLSVRLANALIKELKGDKE